MEQVIELELSLTELATFITALYKEGVRYRFDSLLEGVYRFTITGY